jgi:hypothetical protein
MCKKTLAATYPTTTLERIGTGKEEPAMQVQSGVCYVLWSEQIVQLRERLDDRRWMAVMWNHSECNWSPSVYAIDDQLIDRVVPDPQSIQERCIG